MARHHSRQLMAVVKHLEMAYSVHTGSAYTRHVDPPLYRQHKYFNMRHYKNTVNGYYIWAVDVDKKQCQRN